MLAPFQATHQLIIEGRWSNSVASTQLADGTAVVAWVSQSSFGQPSYIAYQMIDAAGVPSGAVQTAFIATGRDWRQAVTALALEDGTFIIACSAVPSGGKGSEVLLQRFNADGQPLGASLSLGSDENLTYVDSIRLVSLQDGSVGIAWTGYPPDGQSGEIYLQWIPPNDIPLPTTLRFQGTAGPLPDTNPKLTVLENGDVLLSWMGSTILREGANPTGPDILVRRLSSAGSALGEPLVLRSYGYMSAQYRDGDQTVLALDDGGFAVSWIGGFQSYSITGRRIFLQLFDEQGVARGYKMAVADIGTDTVLGMKKLINGDLILFWTDMSDDGQGREIFVQRVPSGTTDIDPTTRLRLHGVEGDLEDSSPRVLALEDGGFVLVWRGQTPTYQGQVYDGQGVDIFGQRFDAAARMVGDFIRLQGMPGMLTDFEPSLMSRPDGGFAVSWAGHTDDKNTWGVFMQVFRADGSLVSAAPTGAPVILGVLREGQRLTVDVTDVDDPDGLGSFSYQWFADGQPIVGAVADDFVLRAADVGASITVVLSYTDALGLAEQVASQATDPVEIAAAIRRAETTTLPENGYSFSLVLSGDADIDAYGNALDNRLIGNAGSNRIEGRAGNGTLNGVEGNDSLFGGGGEDQLGGGTGNDLLVGDVGNDSLYGGEGSDTLNGGTGDDFLFGGATDADLRDVIFGGDGNDSADGGAGNDEINGGNGNDTLIGGLGSDTLIGNDGDDVIVGSGGSDAIFGNAGADFINGGFGYDRLNGGAGADRFFHQGVADHGSDWIQDYSAADGDVLAVAIFGATRSQFQVNTTFTPSAGAANVAESFVIYRPIGQILFALVDGAEQSSINISLGGQVFDLLA